MQVVVTSLQGLAKAKPMGLFLYFLAMTGVLFSSSYYSKTRWSFGSRPMPGTAIGTLYQISGSLWWVALAAISCAGWFVYAWWVPPAVLLAAMLFVGTVFDWIHYELLGWPGIFGVTGALVLMACWFGLHEEPTYPDEEARDWLLGLVAATAGLSVVRWATNRHRALVAFRKWTALGVGKIEMDLGYAQACGHVLSEARPLFVRDVARATTNAEVATAWWRCVREAMSRADSLSEEREMVFVGKYVNLMESVVHGAVSPSAAVQATGRTLPTDPSATYVGSSLLSPDQATAVNIVVKFLDEQTGKPFEGRKEAVARFVKEQPPDWASAVARGFVSPAAAAMTLAYDPDPEAR